MKTVKDEETLLERENFALGLHACQYRITAALAGCDWAVTVSVGTVSAGTRYTHIDGYKDECVQKDIMWVRIFSSRVNLFSLPSSNHFLLTVVTKKSNSRERERERERQRTSEQETRRENLEPNFEEQRGRIGGFRERNLQLVELVSD
ncbi:unnamed protein product [Citrullus colocynthis]|uniref:Uncharacterized protein n=1 Tax=Citrullus colocynthis TaxID=252529 RepID=A0ABP0Z936_9ROSI